MYKKSFLLTIAMSSGRRFSAFGKGQSLGFFRLLVSAVLFFYGVLVARGLGPGALGRYALLILLVNLGGVVADFGSDRILVREIAREPLSWKNRWAAAISARGAIAAILAAFLTAVAGWIGLLAGGTILFGSAARAFDSVLIAQRRVSQAGAALLFQGVAHAVAGLLFLRAGWGIPGLVGAFLLSQFCYFLLLAYLLPEPPWRARCTSLDIKSVAFRSAPYFLVAILAILYARVDLLIVSYWLGEKAAGHYSAAYRFLDAAGLFPAALALTHTPVFSRLHDNPTAVRGEYRSLLSSCLIFGGGSAIALFLFAGPFVRILFGPAFIPAIPVVRVLSLAAFFVFIHSPNVSLVFSIDDGMSVARLSMLTAGFNLLLNLFLVPSMGLAGAAWATVISEVFSFIVFYRYLQGHMVRQAALIGSRA